DRPAEPFHSAGAVFSEPRTLNPEPFRGLDLTANSTLAVPRALLFEATVNCRPFTILLVSPDRLSLRRLSKFLNVFGYDVRQATDEAQALAAAESARPDFSILDGSSGQPTDLQLCRAIRRICPQGYTYTLLLAERPEVGDVTAALEAGFDDFLAAP